MTYTPEKIAQYFIEKSQEQVIETEDGAITYDMTNLKIQKMLYFAHAYFLVKKDRPLVDGTFQAWDLWPVIKDLYNKLCKYNREAIPSNFLKTTTKDISKDDIQLLDEVRNFFSKYSDLELVRISHDHWPWQDFYEKWVKNISIPDKDIKEQFSKIFVS